MLLEEAREAVTLHHSTATKPCPASAVHEAEPTPHSDR